jgi:hypothetical protein
MLIPVDLDGTISELDESLLIRTSGVIENDHERTEWVEYCRQSCADPVHQTQHPAQPEFFCPHRVHRSVHVTLKQGVFGEGVAASFF